MSVSEIVTLAVQHCKAGDYGVLARVVEKYERKIEQLESQLSECVTARFELQTLQQLLPKERSVNAELRRMYEVLLFRTKYQLTGPLTEDRVMDDRTASVDRQVRTIVDSFGIPELPGPLEASSFSTTESYVAALEAHSSSLRSILQAHMKPALIAQISERLMLKRAMDASSAAERDREDLIQALRKELSTVREEEAQRVNSIAAELADAKKRIASFNAQLATEIERAQAVSVQREKDLESYVVGLQDELVPLKAKEVELDSLQREFEASRSVVTELSEKIARTEDAAHLKILQSKRNALQLVRRISLAVGVCAPVLMGKQLEVAVGDSSIPAAASSAPAAASLSTPQILLEAEEMTAPTENDLDEKVKVESLQLEKALVSATSLASMVTLPAAVASIVKNEKSVVASIASTKLKLEKLIQRLDPTLIDHDVADAVHETMTLDDAADDAQEELRFALGLAPAEDVIDVPRLSETAMTQAEQATAETSCNLADGGLRTPHRLPPLASDIKVHAEVKLSAIEAIKEALLKRNLPDVAKHISAVDAARLDNLTRCAQLLEVAQEKFATSSKCLLPPLEDIVLTPHLSVEHMRAVGGKARGKLLRSLSHEARQVQRKEPRLIVKPAK